MDDSARRAVRPASRLGVIGAIGYLGIALLQAADPLEPGDAGFAARSITAAIAAVFLAGTVVALARSGATGGRRAAGIGLAALALGWLSVAAAQVATLVIGEESTTPFVVATALHLGGMVPVAWAVLRAEVWGGLRRWAPALCLADMVVATPLFTLPGSMGHLATSGWGITWLVLGFTLVDGRS